MKIVHFSAGRVNPHAAKVGSVNVLYWLAREQAEMGHDVTVTVIPTKLDYENTKNANFRIIEYPPATMKGFKLPRSLVEDILSGRLQIDLAHLHAVYVPEMIAVASLLRKKKIPYVISTHGSLSPLILKKGSRFFKWMFKSLFVHRYLNGAALLHLHSKGEMEDARWYGVKVPLVVAEHGFHWSGFPQGEIDDEWLSSRYPQYAEAFKLVFLGRMDPWHKGVDLLLEGFSLALRRYENMALFLIGPEKMRYKGVIPRLVHDLDLEKSVVLVAPLYDPIEKFSAIASGDVFVLTSRYEGFPLVLYEAMACGKPLIVTPGTNAADWVISNSIGWVAEPAPESIAQAVIEAYKNRASLKSMGDKARAIIKNFTWRRTAEILHKEYEKVVENAGIW